MKISRLIPITLLAFLAVLTVAIAQSAEIRVQPSPTANSDPPALFTPVQPTGRSGIAPTDPTVIRQRSVTANTSLITRTRGSTITLNLFDDVSYPVVIERVEEQPTTPVSTTRSTGRSPKPSFSQGSLPIKLERNPKPVLVQFGRVRNTPQSEVYLVSSGDTLSATVRLPDGKLYDVNPTSTNTHVIREINPARFPPDEPPGWERMQRSSNRGGAASKANDL